MDKSTDKCCAPMVRSKDVFQAPQQPFVSWSPDSKRIVIILGSTATLFDSVDGKMIRLLSPDINVDPSKK